MRIVYLIRYAPIPGNSGARLRISGIWRALQDHGDVQLIVIGETPPYAVRKQLYALGAKLYPSRREGSFLRILGNRLLALIRGENVSTARYFSPARAERIANSIAATGPNLIILDDTFLSVFAPYFQGLAPHMIIDTHNVESRLMKRIAEQSRNPVQKLRFRFEARQMARLERSNLAVANQIWAVSNDDAKFYSDDLKHPRVEVVPNVIDIGNYTPEADIEGATIAFMGWFYHWPNVDAALRLIDLSERLLARGVRHKLLLIGRDPNPAMVRRSAQLDHVTLTGEVPDVRPLVGRATLFAAPLTAGSGTKLKVLEAMAMARPVVTTEIGAEGLNIEPGHGAIVTDDDEALIDAMADLLADPARASEMGLEGRKFVEDNFSLDAVRASVSEAFDDLPGLRDPMDEPALKSYR